MLDEDILLVVFFLYCLYKFIRNYWRVLNFRIFLLLLITIVLNYINLCTFRQPKKMTYKLYYILWFFCKFTFKKQQFIILVFVKNLHIFFTLKLVIRRFSFASNQISASALCRLLLTWFYVKEKPINFVLINYLKYLWFF